MTDPETPTQPLIRAPSQQAAGPPQRSSSARAYKVAGITLLVCVLIVGQAMIAYFLLSQRNDIKSLEEQNKNLNTKMKSGTYADTPMRIQVPMNSLSAMKDYASDEEPSTEPPKKPAGRFAAVLFDDAA